MGQIGGHVLQQSADLMTAELTGLWSAPPIVIVADNSTRETITIRVIFI